MSTTQEPNRNAIKTAETWLSPQNYPWSDLHKLIRHIEEYAIVPAVAEAVKELADYNESATRAIAERDKRIAELERRNKELEDVVAMKQAIT